MTETVYEVGELSHAGAFSSDFTLVPGASVAALAVEVETDRPNMTRFPGMRHKYMPARVDAATGAVYTGGRYLFDTYEHAVQYSEFLEGLVLPGESVNFWDRPQFGGNVHRYAWRVVGAHDFTELSTTHHFNRFERWHVPSGIDVGELTRLWPELVHEARAAELAAVALWYNERHRLVGVLTNINRRGDVTLPQGDDSENLSAQLSAFERRPSIGTQIEKLPGADKVFDRTLFNLCLWTPLLEQAGGAASIWPNTPPLPAGSGAVR